MIHFRRLARGGEIAYETRDGRFEVTRDGSRWFLRDTTGAAVFEPPSDWAGRWPSSDAVHTYTLRGARDRIERALASAS